VLDAVSDADERRELARLAAVAPDVHWDRLLFSAKESVYKTWFPLTRRWLDFAEAAVTPRLDGTFTARLLVPGPVVAGRPVGGLQGRWLARDGLLLTAIALPVRPPRG
jgi:4'-phosphopantetheinyl transferase EntD